MAAEFAFGPPHVLTPAHGTQEFDCGQPSLNEFLQRHALAATQSGNSLTFVVADAHQSVLGYYSLATASVEHEAAPPRVKQGQPRYPIPAILMAKLAVDASQQGKGLGRALFRDALLRSLNLTQHVGIRAFIVDAKDEAALAYYRQFGMMADERDPRRLYLLFKDIKKILAQ